MDRDIRECSRPFRQGYGARSNGRTARENPYLGAADLPGMYACRQWIEGWKEADGDRLVRTRIDEMCREVAEKMESAT
jgi:ribosome modulation factor